ncbi:alpha/beta hydrolase family protein [Sphingomonas sp. Tas61C01]|uniref:alpha/beta hydrolase family protein n=1 Tax=Sphingomonas sp. Tas61C01 TaxID=3458297 RepID=UPI00403E8544
MVIHPRFQLTEISGTLYLLHLKSWSNSVRTKAVLAVISASLLAQASDARTNRTERTKVAAGASVQEVRIPSVAGVVLAGTFRIPTGRGPNPVLIIQSGSGPSKRGGYLPLEHRLNQVGIATIEFDKRGAGQSTGTFADTMQNMESDIEATIAWLRKRSDVAGTRIALLGHSQGAAAAPEVAARDGHLAAVVFLAGPVGQRGTMFGERMEAQLVESGHSPEASRRVVTATRSWMELRSRGGATEEAGNARAAVVKQFRGAGFDAVGAEGATRVLDSPQALSMYQAAPGTALNRLKIPVLAIFGARDEIVGAQGDAALAALAENPAALVLEVPGANHGFGYRRADSPPRESPNGGPWLSLLPKALITDWLKEQLVDAPQADRW